MATPTRVAVLVGVAVVIAGTAAEISHLVEIRSVGDDGPVCRVRTDDRVVALTFDDGPDSDHTEAILDVLDDVGAHATFFVVGERADRHPTLVARIARSGNEIANHTWTHSDLGDASVGEVLVEFSRVDRALAPLEPSDPVRAPYGDIAGDALAALADRGSTVVHWSLPIDAFLADDVAATSVAERIASEVVPGDILLAHDADDGGIDRSQAVGMLRSLVPMLSRAGFEIVTVSELLERGPPVRAAPRAWFWQSGFTCPRE